VIRKDKEVWGATTLLAEVEIEDGVCTYAFGPMLRKRLYNPTMYARISLSLQNQFRNKHALALYELFVDYLHADNRRGETPCISLPDFRRLMGIPEAMYPEFKKLNKWVIKDPLAEINKVTDLSVTAEHKKEGKNVVAVKFHIRRTLQLPQGDTRQGDLFLESAELPEIVQELIAAGLSRDDALDIWQQGVDYVQAGTKPAPDTFETYLREKINLLKRKRRKVENSTGFLLDAIKKNYANPEFAEEQKAQARKTAARELKTLEAQKDQLKHDHGDALHAHCDALITATPALLEEAAGEVLQKFAMFSGSDTDVPLDTQYRRNISLSTMIDSYLKKRHPEHFQTLLAAQNAELATLDEKIAALKQAA